MNTGLGIKEVKQQDKELYRMCVDFITATDKLKVDGIVSKDEHAELTRIKRKFVEENKHLE